MRHIMVTGPMGAGKSTFMRSLPKSQKDFVIPENVPDMMLDYSCELKGMMFYEIDAPTATGKAWINWLKAADVQIVVGNGIEEPDENFIELWNYLVQNTPDIQRIIILNRTNKITNKWKTYATEKIMCVGIGETIDEETAIASKKDISTIMDYLEEYNE
jgi:septin family protein|tara:strand:- start:2124 stop:2600 length:477 start_codon:yes stop_codon:yes gene_type:complete